MSSYQHAIRQTLASCLALLLILVSLFLMPDKARALTNYGWVKIESDSSYVTQSGEGEQQVALNESVIWLDPSNRIIKAVAAGGVPEGYTAKRYLVDAGTSGLSVGDPVELVFRTRVDGFFPVPPNAYALYVDAVSRGYRVTSPGLISSDDFQVRPGAYTAWRQDGVFPDNFDFGEPILYYLAPPAFTGVYDPDTGVYSYDSGDQVVNAMIGDSLLVEDYFYLRTPTRGNFWDTLVSSVSVGQGYQGVLLIPQPLIGAAPIPEPSSILLLGSGLGALVLWRRKKP